MQSDTVQAAVGLTDKVQDVIQKPKRRLKGALLGPAVEVSELTKVPRVEETFDRKPVIFADAKRVAPPPLPGLSAKPVPSSPSMTPGK